MFIGDFGAERCSEDGTMDRRSILLGGVGLAMGAGSSASGQQASQKRFALVVGNKAYQRMPLTKTTGDAEVMATTLSQLGFKVQTGFDETRAGLIRKLKEFRRQITSGATIVVYYSGHGVQVDGENFLIPVDNANMLTEQDLKNDAVSLSFIITELGQTAGQTNIVILDACRDNPVENVTKSQNSKGLAPLTRASSGTLVAFAASPGQVATESSSSTYSLYTQELVKALRTPGLRIEDVFNRTRVAVKRLSENRQVPQEYASLEGSVYLNGDNSAPEIQPVESSSSIRVLFVGLPESAKLNVNGVARDSNLIEEESVEDIKKLDIVVTAPGYAPYIGSINVKRGSTSRVPIQLVRRLQKVTSSSDSMSPIDSAILRVKKEYDADISTGLLIYLADIVNVKMQKDELLVGAYPVTYGVYSDYLKCIGEDVIPTQPQYDPVTGITAQQCEKFARWLTNLSGIAFRLPTCDEFKWLATAGDRSKKYPWGNAYDNQKAWCSAVKERTSIASTTRSENIYKNELGLTDMAGNIWHWTSDRKGVSQYVKGGSWQTTDPVQLTVDYRELNIDSASRGDIGFRLVGRPIKN